MVEGRGAIAAIYEVQLPRSLDAIADPAFTEPVQHVRKHLFAEAALN